MTAALSLLVVALVSIVAIVTVAGVLVLVSGVVAVVLLRGQVKAEPGASVPGALEPAEEEALPRLLVLRAFLVGRAAGGRHENKLRSVAVVRLEDPALRAEKPPKDALLRGVFYALVLAELDRRMAYQSRRRPAKKLGERLGKDDPYPLVDAHPEPRISSRLGGVSVNA